MSREHGVGRHRRFRGRIRSHRGRRSRRRLRSTRWAERETVGDCSHGVPLEFVQVPAAYRRDWYDLVAAAGRTNCSTTQLSTGLRQARHRPASAGKAQDRRHWRSRRPWPGRWVGPITVRCSVFPREIRRPSRRWAEKRFTNIHWWSDSPKGRHFAAFEQPKFSSVRSDHRSCRGERRCDSGSGTRTRRPASRSPGRRGERGG